MPPSSYSRCTQFEHEAGACFQGQNEKVRALCGEQRQIWGRFLPESVEEVQKIVRVARRHNAKLHAFSTGRNWGFGSFLPHLSGCYLLDLSRMRKVGIEGDYVCLEPGVTQGQLDDYLQAHRPSSYFNVTGAGTKTSVLGNALERGIGYFGSRDRDVLEADVVLGSGELTTFGSVHQSPLGPQLLELFIQSSFGIVVSGKFKLRARPETMGRATVAFSSQSDLLKGIDVLKSCLLENLVHGIPHIFNRERILTTLLPHCTAAEAEALSPPAWSMVLPIEGPKRITENLVSYLRERFAGVGDVQSDLRESNVARKQNLTPQEQLSLLALGHPTDLALASVAQAALGEADNVVDINDGGRAGIIQVTPCLPLKTEVLKAVFQMVAEEYERVDGNPLPLSLNVLDPYRAVLVISVPLDHQSEKNVNYAKAFARQIMLKFSHQGYLPYRLGLAWSDLIPSLPETHQDILRGVGQVCDPDQILTSKYEQLWSETGRDWNFSPQFEVA